MSVELITGLDGQESRTVLWLLLALSVWLVTGTLVGAAFVLPGTVGALISGKALLALGMTFAGISLVLVAATPGAQSSVPAGLVETDRGWFDRSELDRQVVYPVAVIATVGLGGFLLAPDVMTDIVGTVETAVLDTGRPLLHGAVFVFVIGIFWLAIGQSGRIKLGGDDAQPEYSDRAYLAMLFSAGIAAGIVFWGPAEALFHYDSVPPFLDAEARSAEATVGALQYTLFHWGISAWSAYLIVGLPVAYAVYNRGAPMRVSAILAPLLGTDIVDSPVGKLVDVLAVLATLGGLSTTLGFLSSQFLTGIEFRWPVELGSTAQVLFIGGLTGIVVVSVITSVRQGMRRLSVLNSSVFLFVLTVLAVVGPTLFIVDTGLEAFGNYVLGFVPMSLYTGDTFVGAVLPAVTTTEGSAWLSGWTSFYWAWWLSWAPFVGLFIARISRGRTLRSVVFAAGVVTSVATLTWFVVVGATALELQHSGAVDLLGVIADVDTSVAGYPLFDALPAGDFLLIPFLLLVITFFITSADAATRSLALMTTSTDEPSPAIYAALALSIGVIAMTLILFGNSNIVQSAAVVTGGPFAILGLVGLFGLIVAVRSNQQ